MENVEQFIDQLIDAKNLGVEGDVREQLKLDMMERLLDQIDRAAISALPEDKAIELADKIDDENFSDEQVTEFMKNSGLDLQRIALETMLQFRMLYLGAEDNANIDMDEIRKANAERAE